MALPTIIAWFTRQHTINAKAVAPNGEPLNYISQGFERKSGLLKNLRATYGKNYEIVIKWKRNVRSRTFEKTETVIL